MVALFSSLFEKASFSFITEKPKGHDKYTIHALDHTKIRDLIFLLNSHHNIKSVTNILERTNDGC